AAWRPAPSAPDYGSSRRVERHSPYGGMTRTHLPARKTVKPANPLVAGLLLPLWRGVCRPSRGNSDIGVASRLRKAARCQDEYTVITPLPHRKNNRLDE